MRRVGLVVGAVALALCCAGPAFAQSLPTVVDGKTATVSDYDQAIRERVYIPNGLDADLDGVEDRTAIEIMRPRESSPTMKVPAIVAPSPYYTSALRAVRRRVRSATSTATASTTAGRSGTTTTSSRAATR